MSDPKSDFEQNIPAKIAANPEQAKQVGAVFLIRVSGEGGGVWTIDLKNDVGVKSGETSDPDCTIELTSQDWKQLSENPTSAIQLFFQGKLKVTGNAMLATKLQQILG